MLTRTRWIPAVVLALAVASIGHAAPLRYSNAPLASNGTVVIRAEAKYVLIGVAPTGGGKLEDLFVFVPTKSLKPAVARYVHAEVRYDPSGTLRVSAPNEQISMTFTVEGPTRGLIPEPEGFTSSTYSGVGLTHVIGDGAARFGISGGGRRTSGPSIASSTSQCNIDVGTCEVGYFEGFIGITDPFGTTPNETCNQGGPGSTACSYSKDGRVGPFGGGTSCSVTCGSGHYACCKEECVGISCQLVCKCVRG
jgi:hypothetical protein